MDEGSKRDISKEWIRNNVYEALEVIELHERRMKNGCADLKEYIEGLSLGSMISDIQLQNMNLMITEFDILITNTKEILDEKAYEKARADLNILQGIFNHGVKNGKEIINVSETIIDHTKRQRRVELTYLFNRLAGDLAKLRGEMITNLKDILWIIDKNQEREV